MLQVHYKGALTASGEVFDDADLVFPLGRGHVIKGWDAGLIGMKVRGRPSHAEDRADAAT